MLHRIIPTLLIDGPALVKTKKFKDWKYLGDVINVIRIFNEKQVDEIILLDITATPLRNEPRLNLIQEIVQEAFMPFCYGGGIKTVKQIGEILTRGADKVAINSALHEDTSLIKEAVSCFGSQSVVVGIDVITSPQGEVKVASHRGTRTYAMCPVEYAKRVQDMGAGEILLSDINRDGTKSGYNLDLIKAITEEIEIPLIACCGAQTLHDLKLAIEAGASASAAGSLFSLIGSLDAPLTTYPSKSELDMLLSISHPPSKC